MMMLGFIEKQGEWYRNMGKRINRKRQQIDVVVFPERNCDLSTRSFSSKLSRALRVIRRVSLRA